MSVTLDKISEMPVKFSFLSDFDQNWIAPKNRYSYVKASNLKKYIYIYPINISRGLFRVHGRDRTDETNFTNFLC